MGRKKGSIAWNKGKKLSVKHINNLSESHKGQIAWNKGKYLSEEHKKKLSEKHKGQISWNKGKPMSAEYKQNLIKSGTLFIKGRQSWNKGKSLSSEMKKKMSEQRKGKYKNENNPNWRGGITSEVRKIRASIEYELWRGAIFARDNWTCQQCGKRGINLNAHHIKPFAKYPELRFALDNGITLCVKCHKKTNSEQMKGNKNQKRKK